MNFLNCLIYLLLISTIMFFTGIALPKSLFNYNKFPYKKYKIEERSDFYSKIKIKKWKNKLPDMSKLFPMLLPIKSIKTPLTYDTLDILIKETCKAELVHKIECILGLYCVRIWQDIGGIIISVLYIIINIPFILIQRYNRPRMIKMLTRIEKEKDNNQKFDCCLQ